MGRRSGSRSLHGRLARRKSGAYSARRRCHGDPRPRGGRRRSRRDCPRGEHRRDSGGSWSQGRRGLHRDPLLCSRRRHSMGINAIVIRRITPGGHTGRRRIRRGGVRTRNFRQHHADGRAFPHRETARPGQRAAAAGVGSFRRRPGPAGGRARTPPGPRLARGHGKKQHDNEDGQESSLHGGKSVSAAGRARRPGSGAPRRGR